MNREFSGFNTFFLQAIEDQDHKAVEFSLRAGTDPNGASLHDISLHAAGFLRFGPWISYGRDEEPFLSANFTRGESLDVIARQQISPIIQNEIQDRYHDCIGRFWTEPILRPLAQIPFGDTIPAVVEAAQQGSIATLHMLIDSGADISFWQSRPTVMPFSSTASSLAVVTPLHSAIWSRKTNALRYLLNRGFDPNAMPLAAITRCITPAMATISYCNPWNQAAWDCLRQYPGFDPRIRTPIYDVHILHFAVARLSLILLYEIVKIVPLAEAGATALGHSLLHIACLPLDKRYIQIHSEAIYKSIHETRDLSEAEEDLRGRFEEEELDNYFTARVIAEKNSTTLYEHMPDFLAIDLDCLASQTAMVRYLYSYDVADVSKQDVHGNTALHYLASHRLVNHQLIDWLRSQKHGQYSWRVLKNIYGYTASELLASNEAAVENPGGQPFWQYFYDRSKKNVDQEDEICRIRKRMRNGMLQTGFEDKA